MTTTKKKAPAKKSKKRDVKKIKKPAKSAKLLIDPTAPDAVSRLYMSKPERAEEWLADLVRRASESDRSQLEVFVWQLFTLFMGVRIFCVLQSDKLREELVKAFVANRQVGVGELRAFVVLLDNQEKIGDVRDLGNLALERIVELSSDLVDMVFVLTNLSPNTELLMDDPLVEGSLPPPWPGTAARRLLASEPSIQNLVALCCSQLRHVVVMVPDGELPKRAWERLMEIQRDSPLSRDTLIRICNFSPSDEIGIAALGLLAGKSPEDKGKGEAIG